MIIVSIGKPKCRPDMYQNGKKWPSTRPRVIEYNIVWSFLPLPKIRLFKMTKLGR